MGYTTKVTRIKSRWHARLFLDGRLMDEMACSTQQDIGWICRAMLRWQCKMGSIDPFACAARKRQTTGPIDKVWYRNQLKGHAPIAWPPLV